MDEKNLVSAENLSALLEEYRNGRDPLAPVIALLSMKADQAGDARSDMAERYLSAASEVSDLADNMRRIVDAENAASSACVDESNEYVREAIELSSGPPGPVPGRGGRELIFAYLAVTEEFHPDGKDSEDTGIQFHGLQEGHTVQPGVYAVANPVTAFSAPDIHAHVLTADLAGERFQTSKMSISPSALPLAYTPGIAACNGHLFLCRGVEIAWGFRLSDNGVPILLHTLCFDPDNI